MFSKAKIRHNIDTHPQAAVCSGQHPVVQDQVQNWTKCNVLTCIKMCISSVEDSINTMHDVCATEVEHKKYLHSIDARAAARIGCTSAFCKTLAEPPDLITANSSESSCQQNTKQSASQDTDKLNGRLVCQWYVDCFGFSWHKLSLEFAVIRSEVHSTCSHTHKTKQQAVRVVNTRCTGFAFSSRSRSRGWGLVDGPVRPLLPGRLAVPLVSTLLGLAQV